MDEQHDPYKTVLPPPGYSDPFPPGQPSRVPGMEIEGGNYILEELIAEKGQGQVWRARQTNLGRQVAIKFVKLAPSHPKEADDRLLREAEFLARLQHPNVLYVIHAGRHDRDLFFVMELAKGGSLRDKLTSIRKLPWRDAAELIRTLAEAIHVAHQMNIIHRDLKPDNVLFVNDTPKIADFGFAKRLDTDDGLTPSGVVLGTPRYMAPEQFVSGSAVGAAADVWALGVILYECLVGGPPFPGSIPLEILRKVSEDEPKSLRELRPELPAGLERVCLKCLEKQAVNRYISAVDLAGDLKKILLSEPVRPVLDEAANCTAPVVVVRVPVAYASKVIPGPVAPIEPETPVSAVAIVTPKGPVGPAAPEGPMASGGPRSLQENPEVDQFSTTIDPLPSSPPPPASPQPKPTTQERSPQPSFRGLLNWIWLVPLFLVMILFGFVVGGMLAAGAYDVIAAPNPTPIVRDHAKERYDRERRSEKQTLPMLAGSVTGISFAGFLFLRLVQTVKPGGLTRLASVMRACFPPRVTRIVFFLLTVVCGGLLLAAAYLPACVGVRSAGSGFLGWTTFSERSATFWETSEKTALFTIVVGLVGPWLGLSRAGHRLAELGVLLAICHGIAFWNIQVWCDVRSQYGSSEAWGVNNLPWVLLAVADLGLFGIGLWHKSYWDRRDLDIANKWQGHKFP